MGSKWLRARGFALAVITVGGLAANLVFASAAHAADTQVEELDFFAQINAARAKGGVAPLVVDTQLVDVARAWSAKMASDGDISHNPNLSSQIGAYRKLGENVGMGPSVDSIEAAFEASPHHYENMMDPAFTNIGVGVVHAGSTIFVTEDYKQPKSAVSAVTPAKPAPAPAPRPAVAPRPRPATVAAAKPTPAPSTTMAPTTTTTAPPSSTTSTNAEKTPKLRIPRSDMAGSSVAGGLTLDAAASHGAALLTGLTTSSVLARMRRRRRRA